MNLLQITVWLLFIVTSIESHPVSNFGSDETSDSDVETIIKNIINPKIGIIDLIEALLHWRFDPTKLGMDPYERIKSFDYPTEKHSVTTEDGYILTVNRISLGISSAKKGNRPAVLLQPGLLCTPGCYADLGPRKALAYLLADLGYDVWLGTVRGTTFSRNHTTLDPMTDQKYWDYSWHEVGTIDIPTVIDHILKVTGRKTISYIGHSQGTTAYFVMGAEKPEYNDKISVAIALAPVAFMEHIDRGTAIYQLAKRKREIFPLLRLAGIDNVFPHWDPLTKYVQKRCNDNVTDWSECETFWKQMGDYNPEMFDLRNLYIMSEHFPGGASTGQFEHYAQLIIDGGFKQFDYGKRKNLKMYGQPVPPPYNVTKITTPVYLLYGDNDVFTPIQDLKTLHEALPNSKMVRVNYPLFGHSDFLYSKKVIELVYKYVFEILEKYNKTD